MKQRNALKKITAVSMAAFVALSGNSIAFGGEGAEETLRAGQPVEDHVADEETSRANAADEPSAGELDETSAVAQLFGVETLYSDEDITREEFLAVAAKIGYGGRDVSDVQLPFEDVSEISSELLPYMKEAYMMGLLAGDKYNGKLYARPKDKITREDASAVLGRSLGLASGRLTKFTDQDQISLYAYAYVSGLTAEGVISGYPDGSFRPKSMISYYETAVLADRTETLQNTLRSIAGTGEAGYRDGASAESKLMYPKGMGFYANGSILVADTHNSMLRKINMGSVTTVSGAIVERDENGFARAYCLDSTLRESLLGRPYDVIFDAAGSMVFTDQENNSVKIVIDGRLYTLSGGQGSNQSGYQEGSSQEALYRGPTGLAADKENNIYVSDTKNHCIRKIDTEGVSSLYAGTPGRSGYQDGDADIALFNEPIGLDMDDAGNLYVADSKNQRIRKVTPQGKVTTVAGSGEKYVTGTNFFSGGRADGDANQARFSSPKGLCVVADVIFVADTNNDAIRMIRDGKVTTVLGASEQLKKPSDVAYNNKKLYVVDTQNNQIRVIHYEI